MRAEEFDWAIYHAIDEAKGCTMDEIGERTGFPQNIVQESLERLRSYLLIECRGESYRICSIEEMLITKQLNQDPFSDIVIENGIVKVKATADSRTESSEQKGTES